MTGYGFAIGLDSFFAAETKRRSMILPSSRTQTHSRTSQIRTSWPCFSSAASTRAQRELNWAFLPEVHVVRRIRNVTSQLIVSSYITNSAFWVVLYALFWLVAPINISLTKTNGWHGCMRYFIFNFTTVQANYHLDAGTKGSICPHVRATSLALLYINGHGRFLTRGSPTSAYDAEGSV